MVNGLQQRLLAQRLMQEKRNDPFSDSRFFSGKIKPPVDELSGETNVGQIFKQGLSDFGAALAGKPNEPLAFRGELAPIGETKEGAFTFAVPKFLQETYKAFTIPRRIAKGEYGNVNQMQNNPQFIADATDFVTEFGALGALTSQLPGVVPEGAIGVFAGKLAKTFPDKKKRQQLTENLNRYEQLKKEKESVQQMLTMGRMQLGDAVTDDLTKREKSLNNELDKIVFSGDLNTQKIFEDYDQALKKTTPFSFFRNTEREYGKGLFKFPDQQYRFEIDDSTAKINLGIDDNKPVLSDTITSDAFERRFPDSKLENGKVSKITTLGEILEHPELFEAYPQLADYKVNFYQREPVTEGGYFNQKNKEIGISLSNLIGGLQHLKIKEITAKDFKKTIRDTLFHEIQHAVQEIEGFSKGANPIDPNIGNRLQDAINDKNRIIGETADNFYENLGLQAELSNLYHADRIKYFREKALLDSHQPRLLFNNGYWYKYSDEIRREIFDETGITYKKRKTPEREKYISLAFKKLAEKMENETAGGANLANTLTAKEIKSRIGKAVRKLDKTSEDAFKYRDAKRALEFYQKDPRYSTGESSRNIFKRNIYYDTLGEAEARLVGRRSSYPDERSIFPPDDFSRIEEPPPQGYENLIP